MTKAEQAYYDSHIEYINDYFRVFCEFITEHDGAIYLHASSGEWSDQNIKNRISNGLFENQNNFDDEYKDYGYPIALRNVIVKIGQGGSGADDKFIRKIGGVKKKKKTLWKKITRFVKDNAVEIIVTAGAAVATGGASLAANAAGAAGSLVNNTSAKAEKYVQKQTDTLDNEINAYSGDQITDDLSTSNKQTAKLPTQTIKTTGDTIAITAGLSGCTAQPACLLIPALWLSARFLYYLWETMK